MKTVYHTDISDEDMYIHPVSLKKDMEKLSRADTIYAVIGTAFLNCRSIILMRREMRQRCGMNMI